MAMYSKVSEAKSPRYIERNSSASVPPPATCKRFAVANTTQRYFSLSASAVTGIRYHVVFRYRLATVAAHAKTDPFHVFNKSVATFGINNSGTHRVKIEAPRRREPGAYRCLPATGE